MYRYDENHRKTGRREEDGPEETTAQRTPLQRGKRSVWQFKKVRVNMPDYGKKYTEVGNVERLVIPVGSFPLHFLLH